jgi:CBS domain containing-hemolysin-like protein
VIDASPLVIAGLVALLCASALFSGSETALFSLDEKERVRAGPRVERLLSDPRSLLITLLLCNLLINVAYFAFAAQLSPEGELAGVAVGFGVLLAVLVAGEIVPKSIALRSPLACARLAAWPVSAIVLVFTPVRRVCGFLIELVVRALGPLAGEERGITTESLARVLERSASQGLLADSEAGLLAEVIELDGIRVREIMIPRVDMLALDLASDRPQERVDSALEQRQGWLPVIDGDPDNVVGCVRLRDVLLWPERPIAQLMMPVKFVPEVASALDLLRELRESRASEAVVVDEWGGTAGVVTIEDIFEEIVGDLRVEDELREHPVVPLGGGRFRVAGSLSVRDWNEEFGFRVVPTEFETVAGYVTALLGRIPRAGDRVRVGDLVNEVHEVHGRRVISVDMYVEPVARRDHARRAPAEAAR